MWTRLVVLLIAVSCVLGHPNLRIIGGEPAQLGEIPHQISIQTRNNQHVCGGFIISDNFAVTSAHCVSEYPSNELHVVAGIVDLTNPDVGTTHRVRNYVVHPDAGVLGGVPHDDIAIVEVQSPFPTNPNSARIVLPPQDSFLPDGTTYYTSGWGTTSFGGGTSNELLKVNVISVDNATCENNYGMVGIVIPEENVICAGQSAGGADACDGDEGGALVFNGIAVGSYSWGGACGTPGLPSLYTQISAYRDWIDNNTLISNDVIDDLS